MAAQPLAVQVGVAPACQALGVSRATFYRRHKVTPGHQQPRPTPARALCESEREHVLDVLACPRFVDRAPAEVVATLLDEGQYLCSARTMYRIGLAGTELARAQCTTIREKVLKVGAQIRVNEPSSRREQWLPSGSVKSVTVPHFSFLTVTTTPLSLSCLADSPTSFTLKRSHTGFCSGVFPCPCPSVGRLTHNGTPQRWRAKRAIRCRRLLYGSLRRPWVFIDGLSVISSCVGVQIDILNLAHFLNGCSLGHFTHEAMKVYK